MVALRALLAVALLLLGGAAGHAVGAAVGAPPGQARWLGASVGLVAAVLVVGRPASDRRAARRRWWPLAATPAAVLWAMIALLLSIEVQDLVTGAETEHSPLAVVLLYLLLPAVALTWAAVRLRR